MHIALVLAVSATLIPVQCLLAGPVAPKAPKPLSIPQALAMLATSREPKELVRAAETVCASKDDKAMHRLLALLQTPSLLSRLDTPLDYACKTYPRLHVTKILVALARMPGDRAETALSFLSRDPNFMADDQRCCGLVYAAAKVRRPSTELLEFIDRQGTPKNGANVVVQSLALIHTPASCALIEKRLLSPAYRLSTKMGWMQGDIMTVRTQPAIVAMYARVLRSKEADAKLRAAVAEALFDYQPTEWYGTSYRFEYDPPKWRTASPRVLRELLVLADLADKLRLPKETRAAVAKSRKEIQAALAEHKAK